LINAGTIKEYSIPNYYATDELDNYFSVQIDGKIEAIASYLGIDFEVQEKMIVAKKIIKKSS
jgi:hypothetical protein